MISVTHFVAYENDADFGDRAGGALQALADRPGYLRGGVGRSTDDTSAWLQPSSFEQLPEIGPDGLLVMHRSDLGSPGDARS
ncbi:MAG: hypothetical protein ABJB98_00555 [Actinomycetota bacterium]